MSSELGANSALVATRSRQLRYCFPLTRACAVTARQSKTIPNFNLTPSKLSRLVSSTKEPRPCITSRPTYMRGRLPPTTNRRPHESPRLLPQSYPQRKLRPFCFRSPQRETCACEPTPRTRRDPTTEIYLLGLAPPSQSFGSKPRASQAAR